MTHQGVAHGHALVPAAYLREVDSGFGGGGALGDHLLSDEVEMFFGELVVVQMEFLV